MRNIELKERVIANDWTKGNLKLARENGHLRYVHITPNGELIKLKKEPYLGGYDCDDDFLKQYVEWSDFGRPMGYDISDTDITCLRERGVCTARKNSNSVVLFNKDKIELWKYDIKVPEKGFLDQPIYAKGKVYVLLFEKGKKPSTLYIVKDGTLENTYEFSYCSTLHKCHDMVIVETAEPMYENYNKGNFDVRNAPWKTILSILD